MERLTSPNINVDPGTDRFLHAAIGGKEIDWKQSRDSTLNVLINGPTSNGFGKDIFRKMARDLYGRMKAYEDIGLTPEEIKAPFTEDAMINLAAQALGVGPSRLRELAEADKDGRVVVLPCKGYSSIDIARDGVSYRPDHWNIYLTAYAHGQNTPSGLKVGLFDIGEVERAMQEMEDKKDGNETSM